MAETVEITVNEETQVVSLNVTSGGAAGEDGLSAYEVAVNEGFVGTEAQWLASLVGEQGPTGSTGPQGPQGIQGVKGDTGDTGPQGATGPAGADGADGVDGSDATATTDASALTSGVLADARVQESNVTQYSEFTLVGDGSTDLTTELGNALTSYGKVFIRGTVITSSPITLTDNMQVDGSGQINNTTTDVFITNGARIKVMNIRIEALGGHAFNVTNFSESKIENVKINVTAPGKSAYYQEGNGTNAYDSMFLGGEWGSRPSHDAPLFYVSVDDANFNTNLIQGMMFQTNGGSTSAPAIWLECTASANWIYGNTIDNIDFEIPNAGAVHLYSTAGTTLSNNTVFDLGTSTDDLIVLDNTTGGLNPKQTTINGYYRVGGTLGTGLKDIDVRGHYADGLVVINAGGSQSAAVEHDLPNSTILIGGADVVDFGDATQLGSGSSGGGISPTNTPANNEIAYWSGNGEDTLGGDNRLTWNNGTLKVQSGPFEVALGGNDIKFNNTSGLAYISAVGGGGFGFRTRNAGTADTERITIPSGSSVVDVDFKNNGLVGFSKLKYNNLSTAPASATATGTTGEIRVTATHIYVCTATNTWVRTALTTW